MAARRLTVVQMLPALQSGGVERGTLEVGKHLVDNGHRSIVISGGGRMVDQLIAEGSEHVEWDVGHKRLTTLFRYVRRLRRLLIDERVDILHLRSRMPAWVGYLAWKGMDPATRPKLVTTVHGFYSVNRYSAVMTKGERVIAVSNSVRDYILESYPKCDPDRISVIHRGVDPGEFPRGYRPDDEWLLQWREDHPQFIGKRLLVLPGRLTRLKGHRVFIELIGKLIRRGREIHGVIVGGANTGKEDYAEELVGLVSSNGLDEYVSFLGHRNDVREIYAVSSLVLSLSSQPESFGRTVGEALAMGIPVIGFDHGGVSEILSHCFPEGRVGQGDEDELLLRVERVLAGRQPPPLEPFPYTAQRMLSETLTVYQNLVDLYG